jgi:uncharacterized RmlC-like cupin family protein
MKIINTETIPTDTEYERGFDIRIGVSDKTCGAQKITAGRTFLPPGGSNKPHYHANSEAVMYIIQFHLRTPQGGSRYCQLQ